MPALFAATLFLSASLLFLVQPMIAKMLLPKLGGTPQVWTTCMVFFQALLLAGYSYAHFMTGKLGDRTQSRWHIPLMLLPFVFLLMPIGIPQSMTPPEEADPIAWLLMALGVGIGMPFLIVSTSAPLLQRWFAATGHPDGHDPYFLYGASNLGSMLALIGYPLLVEPYLPLTAREAGWELPFGGYLAFDQIWVWTIGYACLVVCTAICARVLQNSPDPTEKKAGGGRQRVAATQQTMPLTPQQRLRWVMLAFVPSSLMLGATTYVTTDIAAIPLLWVIPLALYLLTFIIVFWKYPTWLHRIFILALPVLILLLVFMMLSGVQPKQMWLRILWHLVGFFVAAMVCHGELAGSRPPVGQLTEFYLWMSFGGVLGGLFNGIVAPLVFNTLAEYAIVMVVACLMVPPLDPDRQQAVRPVLDLASLNILAVMGVVLLVFRLAKYEGPSPHYEGLLTATKAGVLYALVGLGVAGLLLYILSNPEQRLNRLMDFGLAAALGLLVIGLLYGLQWTGVVKAIHSWIESWYESTKEDPDVWFKGLRNYIFHERPKVRLILVYGVPAILCYTFVERPVRFGLGVAAILLVGSSAALLDDDVLLRERSFFGVLRIDRGAADAGEQIEAADFYGQDRLVEYHELLHGTTLHGKQRLVSPRHLMQRFLTPLTATNSLELAGAWAAARERWVDPRREPLTYYHPSGPIGQVMGWFTKHDRTPNLAVIGLGTGTMASHCETGQLLHYYDIDPAVVKIAQDPKFFTYVPNARERGVNVEMILGDARIAMEKQTRLKPDLKYGLIVVDAFTSDAIPIHLITREAVKVYLNKLADDGIIAFHISNRHLRLKPVLANLADHLQLAGIGQYDQEEKAIGKSRSDWVLFTRKRENYGELVNDKRWEALKVEPRVGVWTDNFSNVLSVFNELTKDEGE